MSWLKLRQSKARLNATLANARLRSQQTRQGRVYIIPTKFGGTFLAGSFLMILIGSAYNNNLVNLLGFFMMAVLFVAMIATHNNITGIEISRVETTQGFAGETFPVSIVVRNTTSIPKSNCDFTIRDFKKVAQYDARAVIPPHGDARLIASFDSPVRGLHALKRFVLSTTAPFGLFYAWQYRMSDAVALIYPRRQGELNWTTDQGLEIGSLNRAAGAEDYNEHRSYQAGDNLKRVDWQAFARGRPLLTKTYDEPVGEGLNFDFHRLSALDHEQRLEQLSRWIDLASQRHLSFTVTLPSKRLGPGQGLAFAHRTWSELARFEIKSSKVDN